MIDLTKANIDKTEYELLKDVPEEELIKYIYEKYYMNQRLSMAKVGNIFGKGSHYYSNKFKEYGLKARSNQEKGKIYICNEDYFESIDTEDKAYWLGFIYADGYIQAKRETNTRKIGLSISNKDIEHLRKFKKCLNATHEIREYKVTSGYSNNTVYCRLLITSEKLAHDLEEKGCFENKTNILKFPTKEQVPQHLIRHFIRGYFDGDGSIWHTSQKDNKDKTYSIDFCGTDDFLTGIMRELIRVGIINHTYKFDKRKKGQTVSRFRFGGNLQAKAFCEYIYKDATICLQRKYDRYKDLVELLESMIRVNQCYVCGTTESYEFDMWSHGGEYDGKILCHRHYQQMRKCGEIIRIDKIPNKEENCYFCGDCNATDYHVWMQEDEYYGKTLCRKHYDQLRYFGFVVDTVPAKHKKTS